MLVRPAFLACLGVIVGGCIEAASPPSQRGRGKNPPAAASDRGASVGATPEFVPAPHGEVDAAIREAVSRADQDDRQLVVYVGATWCEPCQYFHRAVEAGQLDHALPGVRFLEFDADVDGERLELAGYGGRLIPRFALPGPDGRFGGKKVEGGVKGDGAVAHIMARLGPMLER